MFKKKQPQKPINEFYINKQKVTIVPASLDEMLEVVFLVLPYIKGFQITKNEYRSENTPADLYFDIVHNILQQMRKEDFTKAVSILLHQDSKFVETLTFSDVMKVIPAIIRENKILDLYHILTALGVFE